MTHWFARRTRPKKGKGPQFKFIFEGEKCQIIDHFRQHILKQKRCHWLKKDDSYFIIDEKGGLFTYGNFYHVETEFFEKGLIIKIQVQAKLIQSPVDSEQILELFPQHMGYKHAS